MTTTRIIRHPAQLTQPRERAVHCVYCQLDTWNPCAQCDKHCECKPPKCQWYVLCENDATIAEPHPTLGMVPACKRCSAYVNDNDDLLCACGDEICSGCKAMG
jgi:hypothetical protein